ncbi:MAG: hypothetical protein J2P45_12310 [Candidatus Dormibacteraeota bacterium]|nr:hypothetical protein [Candidatus Dormibacteraeota bacterium]
MQTQSPALSLALVAVAVICVILAVLYFMGTINFLSTHASGRHTTHTIVLGVVAVVALIGANFARPKKTVS